MKSIPTDVANPAAPQMLALTVEAGTRNSREAAPISIDPRVAGIPWTKTYPLVLG